MQIEARYGGKSFRARVRKAGGGDISKTFTSRADAVEWASACERAIQRGALAEFQHKDTLLDDLLEKYGERVSALKKGAKQEQVRIRALRASKLAKLSVQNLNRAAIRQWRDKQRQGPGLNRTLALLSSALKWARSELDAPVDPSIVGGLKLKENPHRERRLQAGEEEALLAASPDWLKPLLTILIETALRRGELCALTWADVDLQARVVTLQRTKNGDRAVQVPLSTRAVAAFKALPRGIAAAPVVQAHPDNVSHAFADACKAAGIVGLTLHDLRAECISRLLERGLDIVSVRAISRHRSSQFLKYIRRGDVQALAARLG